MMYELSIIDDFASAHYLRKYDGPCKELHGHTWKVEIIIEAQELNEMGVVIDFRGIKKKLKDFLNNLDHVCLNDLPEFQEINPSTENLARYVFQKFRQECEPFLLKKVRVWESERASVTYSE